MKTLPTSNVRLGLTEYRKTLMGLTTSELLREVDGCGYKRFNPKLKKPKPTPKSTLIVIPLKPIIPPDVVRQAYEFKTSRLRNPDYARINVN